MAAMSPLDLMVDLSSDHWIASTNGGAGTARLARPPKAPGALLRDLRGSDRGSSCARQCYGRPSGCGGQRDHR
jgi:hypothetical protein